MKDASTLEARGDFDIKGLPCKEYVHVTNQQTQVAQRILPKPTGRLERLCETRKERQTWIEESPRINFSNKRSMIAHLRRARLIGPSTNMGIKSNAGQYRNPGATQDNMQHGAMADVQHQVWERRRGRSSNS